MHPGWRVCPPVRDHLLWSVPGLPGDLVTSDGKPAKTKALEAIDWGELLVTLGASGGVITTLINVLQSWLGRQEQGSVKLKFGDDEIEVNGKPSEEQQLLINAFLSRHRGFVVSNE